MIGISQNGESKAMLGVDVGGTFTDAVLVAGDSVATCKVSTTPGDQAIGVLEAVDGVLGRAGLQPAEIDYFAHGMTVATNALLEQRGARTALLTTEGFEDVLEIGRQARADLYRLCAPNARPLIPRELRLGVPERIAASGVIKPLDEAVARALCRELRDQEIESLAICLLFSFSDSAHEARLVEIAREELGDIYIAASHQVLNVFREFERCSTTAIDAYLGPLLQTYMVHLAAKAAALGIPEPSIMQSSGGVVPARVARDHAATAVLSGPAGGAVGAAYVGSATGFANVVGFDMGGTSCDVCVVDGGRVRQTTQRQVAGRVLQLPMVDVHTVGAGGGSIAWRDGGGALRVGPRSAGSAPGPACYGRGGEQPTVTDANLALGYLGADSVLADDVALDPEQAKHTLAQLGESLSLSSEEAAAGVVRIANQEMERALRVVTVERGVDPREYALLAFGGAGPMHAVALAEALGIETVIYPAASGVLSALGLVTSERRRDLGRSVLLSGSELTRERIATAIAELAAAARAELGEGEIRTVYDMRYRGQAFELPIEAGSQATPEQLRELFEEAHRERYGYLASDAETELVNVRVALTSPGSNPKLVAKVSGRTTETKRPAFFEGTWAEVSVLRGVLAPGEAVDGPAICELPESTVVVGPGWRGETDPTGTLILRRRC